MANTPVYTSPGASAVTRGTPTTTDVTAPTSAPPPAPGSRARRRVLRVAVVGLLGFGILLLLLVSPALAPTPSFPDVPAGHPYYDAITDLASRGIISGYTSGLFGPADPVKRQQFAKMVVLTCGYPVSPADISPFTDVDATSGSDLYPDHYVAVAAARGITVGIAPGLFSPGAHISRYQVISMVARAAKDLAPGLFVTPPGTYAATPGWGDDLTHGDNARWAEYNGLLAGLPLAQLDPWGEMTRGEVAQILHNLLLKLGTPSTTTTTVGPTSTTSSTTTTIPSTTTTTVPPTGDLMHFWWTAADGWQAENLSLALGSKVAGSPVAQITGNSAEDSLVVRGVDGDPLLFERPTSQAAWSVGYLTPQSGPPLAGPLAGWSSDPGTGAQHYDPQIVGPSPAGDLLHFWSGPGGDYLRDNITALTGQKVRGQQAVYIPLGSRVEHVAAWTPENDLVVFWGAPLEHNWQVANVSQETGAKIAGSPVAWTYIHNGGPADNLAALGPTGDLLHFRWTESGGWTVENLTAATGVSVEGDLIAWCSYNMPTPLGSEHIAGVDASGRLIHFWRQITGPGFPGPTDTWSVEDISATVGVTVTGPLGFYWELIPAAKTYRWYEHIVARDSSGHLIVIWDELGKFDWTVADITQETQSSMEGPFAQWSTFEGTTRVFHLAGVSR